MSVTVLANFDVVVEAPSYPDTQLAFLAPACVKVKEDGQIHLWRLDRKRVLELVASAPRAPEVKGVLERLTGRPLPDNVATDLESWCGHAEKLTVFEGTALIELRGPDALRRVVRGELGNLVVDDQLTEFLVVKEPVRALSVLEQRGRVPQVAAHRADRFSASEGRLASAAAPGRRERRARRRPPAASGCASSRRTWLAITAVTATCSNSCTSRWCAAEPAAIWWAANSCWWCPPPSCRSCARR